MKSSPFVVLAVALTVLIANPRLSFAQSADQFGTDQNAGQDKQKPGMNHMMRNGMMRNQNGSMMNQFNDQSGTSDQGRDLDRHRAEEMGRMMRHRGMMGEDHGAHFRIARGDTRIDIQCPGREDLQNCIGAATKLLNNIIRLRDDGYETKPDGNRAPGTNENSPISPR